MVIDMEPCAHILDVLDLVKKTLQGVPRFGAGFGQLCHQTGGGHRPVDLSEYAWPRVSLHYRSFIEQFFREGDDFKVINRRVENIPHLLDPGQAKFFSLELWVLQERKKPNWFLNYDPWKYGQDWIDQLGVGIGEKVSELLELLP